MIGWKSVTGTAHVPGSSALPVLSIVIVSFFVINIFCKQNNYDFTGLFVSYYINLWQQDIIKKYWKNEQMMKISQQNQKKGSKQN